MEPGHDALVQRVKALHREVSHLIFRSNIVDWLTLDLSMAQLKALFALQQPEEGEEATVGSVAQRLQIGLPAASHLVDRLVQLELVRRCEDPADRRRTLVCLTPDGSDLAARLRAGTRGRFNAWVSVMGDEELDTLARGLASFKAAIERVEGISSTDSTERIPAKNGQSSPTTA